MTRRSERGSVLVEAMVAVAILAVVLAFATRAVGDGARRTAAVERNALAELEARSRLAEVGADIALAPGTSSGQDGDLNWRVSISPGSGADDGVGDARLMAVRVDVTWSDAIRSHRPVVTLRSLRLASGAPS